MNRRQLFIWSFVLLAAAALFAVQRDTFLRRWLLPTPREISASPEDWSRRIAVLRLTDASLTDAVAEIGRLTGTEIRVDPKLVEAYGPRPITLDLTDVTIAEVIRAFPRSPTLGDYEMLLMRRPEGLVLRSSSDVREMMVVRVYDIDPLLPTVYVPVSPEDANGICFFSPPATPEEGLRWDRLEFASQIAGEVHAVVHLQDVNTFGSLSNQSNQEPPQHCGLVNNRLIVVAPAIDQPTAAERLRQIHDRLKQLERGVGAAGAAGLRQ